ncbi:MAG: serine/threonine protein kinase [Gemmatimonadaceae bacterium]|nr:serine/threonine protein kinase [Gemmatimonadaceae bacterium]
MPPSPLDHLRHALGHRYTIERELGRGGMGAVYLARDRQLDRPVALKVLPQEFATDAALRERFLRETRTAASFSHPNIVPVYAVEDGTDVLAFAMAYVEGESLAARVARAGAMGARDAVRLLQDIGYALAYAHGRGVIHRDLKPDNIMLERATGRALLMDFGISRTINVETTAAVAGLTRVGEVVGTPEFMSPEQACGDVVDGRSDIYALGLVAYFAMRGELAIRGESTQKILAQQLTQPVPSVGAERSDLPAALVEAIDRCTRKEPSERFANAESLIEALDAAQLKAPEVPYVLRQFAREVATIHVPLLACVAACVATYYYITEIKKWSASDAMFALSLFVAVGVGRLWQLWAERQRLLAEGYDRAAIRRAFQAIVDEREEARAALRAQPSVVARRRRVILSAVGAFLLSYGVAMIARATRTQIGPMQWSIPPFGIALFYLSSALKGGAIVAFVRTPLRMPIGERLFRWFWLGAPGTLLIGRRSATASVGRTVPPTQPVSGAMRLAASMTPAAAVPQPVRAVGGDTPHTPPPPLSLEARVAELERWREREDQRRREPSR